MSVIAHQGGEALLPHLVRKLSEKSQKRQDLKNGIIVMTYTKSCERAVFTREYSAVEKCVPEFSL